MATLQLAPSVVPNVQSTDSGYKVVQGWRDGSMSTVDFIERMSAAGRLMTANFGSVVTALTFLITAANRPDMFIRVPSGTTIIPVKLDIAFNSMAGTVTMVDSRVCLNDIGNGTSSAATVGPVNSRTDNPATGSGVAGLCIARQLATADTTAETTPFSLFRHSYIRADDAGSNEKNLHLKRDDLGRPFLVGPCTWETFVQATTTQATGFGIKSWIETPSIWWT